MGVFLLLFLMSTALVADLPSVYVVEVWEGFDGIYEEEKYPRLHFKRIGQPDSDGDYSFLYREPDHPDTWTFGYGEDFSNVRPYYRAPARAGKPASTQWKSVGDEFTRDFKVVEVKNITAAGLTKKLEEEDVIQEETILCLSSKFLTQIVVVIPKDDCRICNMNRDCKQGLDEANCPPYVAPSFRLPLYCTLVVLILGILFHLGWQAVTKAAEDEIRAREDNLIIGMWQIKLASVTNKCRLN